jgi:hypothetical protein
MSVRYRNVGDKRIAWGRRPQHQGRSEAAVFLRYSTSVAQGDSVVNIQTSTKPLVVLRAAPTQRQSN